MLELASLLQNCFGKARIEVYWFLETISIPFSRSGLCSRRTRKRSHRAIHSEESPKFTIRTNDADGVKYHIFRVFALWAGQATLEWTCGEDPIGHPLAALRLRKVIDASKKHDGTVSRSWQTGARGALNRRPCHTKPWGRGTGTERTRSQLPRFAISFYRMLSSGKSLSLDAAFRRSLRLLQRQSYMDRGNAVHPNWCMRRDSKHDVTALRQSEMCDMHQSLLWFPFHVAIPIFRFFDMYESSSTLSPRAQVRTIDSEYHP